jgi:hypothetical protein
MLSNLGRGLKAVKNDPQIKTPDSETLKLSRSNRNENVVVERMPCQVLYTFIRTSRKKLYTDMCLANLTGKCNRMYYLLFIFTIL